MCIFSLNFCFNALILYDIIKAAAGKYAYANQTCRARYALFVHNFSERVKIYEICCSSLRRHGGLSR